MGAPVTLITGCSTGIGYLTALEMARRGYTVHATMRSPDRDGTPLRDAAAREGLDLRVAALDVTDRGSRAEAVAEVIAVSGRIDVLVNNAGLGDLGAIELQSDETVHRMFETNVFGPLALMRAVLPGMRERQSGTIVNVSSVAGRIVGGVNGIYSATKHALEAISEALALEVRALGVRVIVIEPGFFQTPILQKATGAIAEADGPYADIQRRMATLYTVATAQGGDPAEVAKVISDAVSTDAPRFRYAIGADAPVFLEGRAKMTDEEYIDAFGREQTDEAWFAEFARRFPLG